MGLLFSSIFSRDKLYNKCLELCIRFDKDTESYPDDLKEYIYYCLNSKNQDFSLVTDGILSKNAIPNSEKQIFALSANYYGNGSVRRYLLLLTKTVQMENSNF